MRWWRWETWVSLFYDRLSWVLCEAYGWIEPMTDRIDAWVERADAKQLEYEGRSRERARR